MESMIERGKIKFKELVLIMFIFFYITNVINVGTYLPFVILPFILVYLVNSKIGLQQMSIIFFSIMFAISLYLYHQSTIGTIIMQLTFPICFYVLGNILAKNDPLYKKTYTTLMVVIGSATIFGLACVVKTINLYGNVDGASVALNGRSVLTPWGGGAITATGLNTYMSLGLSLLPIVFIKGNRKLRLISFLFFLVTAYCTILMGNRTGILVAAISIVVSMALSGKASIKKLFGILILCGIGATTARVFMSAFGDSLLLSRLQSMDNLHDPRFDAWKAVFWGMFKYPMGGKQTVLIDVNYAHNMWLDVAYEAGIAPFLLLLLFTVLSIKSVLKFRKSSFPTQLKLLILCLFTAFLVVSFFEPILEGWFYFFNIFCLVAGMVSRLVIQNRDPLVVNEQTEIKIPRIVFSMRSKLLITSFTLLMASSITCITYMLIV
ncbi:O-antigen ligase family protein [Paenibacillus lignilyticus]|uniref:O-antigen ligase family protein n=1 Tax=Paenibacillus lignilyticus TaxID=1172615 RepID=A0ABS5CG20_9BACL|nr:hypothetical protein [Paenibacillus lignilyticus]MBP3964813.1 hypothetical protein [Paenibacillus lignilyticus]